MQSIDTIIKNNIMSLKESIKNHENAIRLGDIPDGDEEDQSIETVESRRKARSLISRANIAMILTNCDKAECIDNIKGKCTCFEIDFAFKKDKIVCGSMRTEGTGCLVGRMEVLKKELKREEKRLKEVGG